MKRSSLPIHSFLECGVIIDDLSCHSSEQLVGQILVTLDLPDFLDVATFVGIRLLRHLSVEHHLDKLEVHVFGLRLLVV